MLKLISALAAATIAFAGMAQAQAPATDAEIKEALLYVGLSDALGQVFNREIKICKEGVACRAKTQSAEYIDFMLRCSHKQIGFKRYTSKPIASEHWMAGLKLLQDDRDSCIRQLRFYEEQTLAAYQAAQVPAPAQAQAVATVDKKVWYERDYDKPRPTTLKDAIAAEKDFLGADNPYWKPAVGAPGLADVCAALKSVGVTCDYNTRVTVSQFLTFYGKGMFPAAGNTNPYCTVEDRANEIARGRDIFPDDCFIGRPAQNKMLADAVRKNRHLFTAGDLTKEAVQKSWK